MTDVQVITGVIPEWTLGDRLRRAREYAGLSRAELAELAGISRRSVLNYETGMTTPRALQLRAIAAATGVDVDWLGTRSASIRRLFRPILAGIGWSAGVAA